MKFYKFVNPEGHNGMVYKEGLNTDILPFNPKGDCEPGGVYFSREDILAFLGYGPDLYEVEPVGEVYENPGYPKKWKAHEVKLKYVGERTDLKVLKMLLDEGADIHAGADGLIYWAATKGHTDIVAFALDQGADIHVENDAPLRRAARFGSLETVKLLLERGANIHADGDGALWRAACDGHLEIVKFLLDEGAYPNCQAAFTLALHNGHTEVVKLLTENRYKAADIKEIDK